jgi:hypothetical protein
MDVQRLRPTLAISLAASIVALAGCGFAPLATSEPSAAVMTAPASSAAPTSVASGAPSATPVPSPATPIPADPIEATVESEGISVTLALERDRIRAGDPLRFVIRAVNDGAGVAVWAGGECNLVSAVRVEGPPVPQEPMGRIWDGDADILKRISISSDRPPGAALTTEQWDRGDREGGCDSLGGIVDEIPSGGQTDTPGIWPATTSTGAPVSGGDYLATATFPFLGRRADTPAHGWSPDDITPITVSVPLVVVPVDGPSLSAGEAMDVVLADPAFAAWLATLTRERWDGSDLHYEAGQWVFVLDFDEDARRAGLRIDAAPGVVVDRTLPDIGQP